MMPCIVVADPQFLLGTEHPFGQLAPESGGFDDDNRREWSPRPSPGNMIARMGIRSAANDGQDLIARTDIAEMQFVRPWDGV